MVARKNKTIVKNTVKNLKNNQAQTEKDTCFTIMPFGGWFDDYYETICRPAIEEAGLASCRADDLYRPSTIVNDIWAYTQKSKLVLADLSGKNPNVFYELGLAHALAKPAILITESIEDVPFDLRALRVLEYDKNLPRWGEVLQEKITISIREVIKSPIQAVLPAFLSIKHDSKPKTVTEQEMELLEMRREIDLLRHEIVRNRSRGFREMDPLEARERIRNYIESGMPNEVIIRRLQDRGVPFNWVEREIRKYSTQHSLDLSGVSDGDK